MIRNAMIDRKSGAVLRCLAPATVRLARDNSLLVTVRDGGHNISGNAVCEGELSLTVANALGPHRPEQPHRPRATLSLVPRPPAN